MLLGQYGQKPSVSSLTPFGEVLNPRRPSSLVPPLWVETGKKDMYRKVNSMKMCVGISYMPPGRGVICLLSGLTRISRENYNCAGNIFQNQRKGTAHVGIHEAACLDQEK